MDERQAIDLAANDVKALSFFAESIAQAGGFRPRPTLSGKAGSAASATAKKALERLRRERETDS